MEKKTGFYILFSFFLFKTSIIFMKHKIQSKCLFNRKKGENNIMKYEIKRSETKTTDPLEKINLKLQKLQNQLMFFIAREMD